LVSELQKGDRVTTSSGIRGTIANVKDDTITLLIADGVKIELEKGHIVNKLNTSGS
jgi:preprotein translocase subunit YajC